MGAFACCRSPAGSSTPEAAVFDYLEVFDNRLRRHGRLGNVIPDQFEEGYRSSAVRSNRSLVLVSNTARISRPPKAAWNRIPGIETVIKAERYRDTIERQFDEHYSVALAKAVGAGTLEAVARSLASLHRPATYDYAAKFGLGPAPSSEPVERAEPVAAPPPVQAVQTAAVGAMVATCDECGRALSAAVIAYLAANAHRFDGKRFCYDCQRKVRRRMAPGHQQRA